MTVPTLSVIIPTYNRAGHLPGSVESVLAHAGCDVEVIVVDDGSTDETAEVARAFGPPVVYLRQENAGPSSARNAGFAASRGRYVAFLDSDDRWIAGAPSRLVEYLDQDENIAVVFGDSLMGTPESGYASFVARYGGDDFTRLPCRHANSDARIFERRPFFQHLVRRNFVFLGSLMMRREAFDRGGGFDPSSSHGEDWGFFLSLASEGQFAFLGNGPISFYMQDTQGLSKQLERMNEGFAGALRLLLERIALDTDDRRCVERRLACIEFGNGYSHYNRGELAAARKLFGTCLRTRPSPTYLAFWLASHLPTHFLQLTRGLKRRIVG